MIIECEGPGLSLDCPTLIHFFPCSSLHSTELTRGAKHMKICQKIMFNLVHFWCILALLTDSRIGYYEY